MNAAPEPWSECRFLTCSVLPVRMACDLDCPFCFSKSSISALRADRLDWRSVDLDGYFRFSRERGATRLVVTGGGEPLLRADDTVWIVEQGRRFFDEIACFTNGSHLTAELARRLADAGLSYVCWSRHAVADADSRALMGEGAPALEDVVRAAGPLKIRATCVLTRGGVETAAQVREYVDALSARGIREFTFKHTYVAWPESVFGASAENRWAQDHRVGLDAFREEGTLISTLPWGPCVLALNGAKVCFYREPTPQWELENRTCRSVNLLSDGSVYASLEAKQSLLYRLTG